MPKKSKANGNQCVNNKSLFLNTNEAAEVLKLRPNTLAKMRVYGTGPEYRKHCRNVLYHIDDLKLWSDSHKYRSTSEEA